MSPSSLRVLAAVAAAVLAVLTGVVTGLVSSGPSFAVAPALVAFGGACAVGAAAFALVGLAGRRRPAPERAPQTRTSTPAPAGRRAAPRPEAAPRTEPAPPPGAARSDGALAADRAALVRACIYVRDRISSRALADRLGEALQEAGISTDEPAGDRFDPAQHEAGSATPAGDPEQVGTIAAVEVPGYTDRGGRVLRAPVVTVYQSGASQPAGSTSAGSELAGYEDATEPRHRAKEDR